MFETDLDETISQSYIRKYSEKFFPVLIIQKPDYLLIEDKRIDSQIVLPTLFILMLLPVFIMFLGIFFAKGWWILSSASFALLFLAVTYWLLSVSYGQRLIFYKDQDRYETIKKRLFSFAKKKRLH